MKTLLIRCWVSTLVIVVCTSLSSADIRYVAQSGQTPAAGYLDWESAADNIQDAINAAKSGDTIIVSNGVYDTGTVLAGEHLNRINMNKNNLTLIAFSTNPEDTVIMGGGTLESDPIRCVYVSGNSCTIAGFALTNGFAVSTGAAPWGGGGLVRINTATGIFMMSNCWVTGCSSSTTGGGVHLQNYSGTFTHCKFSNNYSQYRGGGIFANVGATVRPGMILHSEIVDNYAEDYGGGTYGIDIYDSLIANNISESSGGGSFNCNAERCTFYNNDARGGSGGGAVFCRTTDIISECTIVSNKTAKHGGATYYGIIKDSVVAWNSAENYAGGCYYPTLVEDALLHNNSAGTIGGALFGTADSVVIGCTIVSNTAGGNGGGVHRIASLENCTIAYNKVV